MYEPFNQYIRDIQFHKHTDISLEEYPYYIVRNLTKLEMHPQVTFLVGENGSGKSTLLEAIAIAYGLNPEGGSRNMNFATRNSHSCLHEHLRVSKGVMRPRDAYFLRAESFYNVATNIDTIDKLVNAYGGISLHNQSHGESFFSLFTNRFLGNGLYILDEPEAALSPMRQMAMLTRMNQLIKNHSQFIIATHSPILLAYPNASIFAVDQSFAKVAYKDTDNYRMTKDFLLRTDQILNVLLEDEV